MAYIGREVQYGVFTKQTITADSATTDFTLGHSVTSASSLLVSVGGVIQEPDIAYSATGTSLVFITAPTTGDIVYIIYLGRELTVANAPRDNITFQTGTGDGTTTPITLSTAVPSAQSILVSMDGVTQVPATDYGVVGTTLTFTTAPAVGVVILIYQLGLTSYIGTPSDGTVTDVKIAAMSASKLTGTIADSQIAAMAATKLTGTIADARISESSVTQHVTATDLTNLESRLKTSELRIAGLNDAGINNSEGSFADAYTNETGVDTGASTNESYDAVNNIYSIAASASLAITSTMSSATAPSGTVSTNSEQAPTWAAWKVFDKAAGTWFSNGTNIVYIQYAFNNGLTTKVIDKYTIKAGTGSANIPKDYSIKASNTGSFSGEEITLDTQTSQSFTASETKSYSFANSTSYIYYRLDITDNAGGSGSTEIDELEFFEKQSVLNLTLISNTVTAETEPTTVEVLLVNQPVDTVTLNTDLTMEVSIDGGATYDAVTLVDKGLFATGQNLLRGSADVTARTGTSIKYRLKTLNTKEQNQIGIVLAWS